jgi:hypothetical protein
MVLVRTVVGAFLVAHGLVHLLYLADDVPEFSVDRSWLVPGSARRPLALALVAATVVAFVVLAWVVWGLPGLTAVWPGLVVVAGLLSLVLLILFWNWWLVLGCAIDIGLIAVALIRPEWMERLTP